MKRLFVLLAALLLMASAAGAGPILTLTGSGVTNLDGNYTFSVDSIEAEGTAMDGEYTPDVAATFDLLADGTSWMGSSASDSTYSGDAGSFIIPAGVWMLGGVSDPFVFAPDAFAIVGYDMKDPSIANFFGFTFPVGLEDIYAATLTATQAGDTWTFEMTNEPVPEPGTLLLLGTGLVSVARFARRRRR